MSIICKLFGHKVTGLNTKRYFAHCGRCFKGLKVTYDMAYGDTLVTGDYGNQKTFCWCDCGNELCSSDSYVPLVSGDITLQYGGRLERYKCSKCGAESYWDFDTPVPVRITNLTKTI